MDVVVPMLVKSHRLACSRFWNGPVCTADGAWWQVNYNGLIGWTVEGQNNDYWLEPALTGLLPITAENATSLTLLTTIATGETRPPISIEGKSIYVGGSRLRRYDFASPFAAPTDMRWVVAAEYPDVGNITHFRQVGTAFLVMTTAPDNQREHNIYRFADINARQVIGSVSGFIGTRHPFSPDGNFVVIGTDELEVYDLRLGLTAPGVVLRGNTVAGTDATFSPDNRFLAAHILDEENYSIVPLWDTTTWEIHTASTDYPINDVEFMVDSQRYISVRMDTNQQSADIFIYDANTGTQVNRLSNTTTVDGRIGLTIVSPDGQTIVSNVSIRGETATDLEYKLNFWDGGNVVQVVDWDAIAGTESSQRAVNMMFSEDGRLLVTSDSEGNVRIWGIPLQG